MKIEKENTDLPCNYLILYTTTSERDALKTAAREAGLCFERKYLGDIDRYYSLGKIGSAKVIAARTEMGPFGFQGSAARAMLLTQHAMNLRIATAATGIIQLGMAYGIDPRVQSPGDVLVSTSLIPYDNRDMVVETEMGVVMPPPDEVEPTKLEETTLVDSSVQMVEPRLESANGQPYTTDYTRAKRFRAKQSLIDMLQREADDGEYTHRIIFGGMLSGAARIFSTRFLLELALNVPQAEDGVIGGDMEGVGLLSTCPSNDPHWIVVKAISDFADDTRGTADQMASIKRQFEENRALACHNSARFVLNALANAPQ